MKIAVVLFSLTVAAFAQDVDRAAKNPTPTNPSATRKLESITWDLQSEKLVWKVQTGTMVEGKFAPTSEERYEITPGDAVMAFSNEKRGFTQEEATSLRHLLDVLSLYCAESVAWWDDGQGTPLGPNGKPTAPQKQGPNDRDREAKPTKVASPYPAPQEPVRQLKLSDLLADAQ